VGGVEPPFRSVLGPNVQKESNLAKASADEEVCIYTHAREEASERIVSVRSLENAEQGRVRVPKSPSLSISTAVGLAKV